MRSWRAACWVVVALLATVFAAQARELSTDARGRYRHGSELAERHGRYREALEEFRAVLAEDPDHAPSVVSAAQCHAALGDLDPARALYTRALTLGLAAEGLVTVRRELGKIGLRQGVFDDAQAHLENARRIAGNDAEIAALLGDVYRKRGAPSEAAAEYTRALSLDATRREAHVGLASACLETGDAPSAIRHARAAIELDPFDPDAWYLAARALTKSGEREQAPAALASYNRMRAYSQDIEAIGEALDRDPTDMAALQALADRHAREGAVDHAVAAYERAAATNDGARQTAYANIALLRLRQSDTQAAETALRMASESGGEDAVVHTAYGDLHSARRDWGAAAESYRAAVSLNPSMTHAWVGLMHAAAMTGGRTPAEAVLDEWLAADPDSSTAWNERGLLDYADGKRDRAIGALEKAVALDVTNHEAANNLAWVYAETGRDLTRARELVNAVIAATPTPAAFDTLAYIEQQTGDLAAALIAIERATAMDPTNAEYRRRQDDIRRTSGK